MHIRTALAECGDFATYLQTISDEGGLDEGRCWKVLCELTEVSSSYNLQRRRLTSRSQGLRHIHSLGILHLDLKPANILINQSGTLQISDFGLSIRLASLTSDGYPVMPEGDVFNVREGDREYLSPEMLKGVYGTFSDVFSLGATMLEVAFNVVLPSSKSTRIAFIPGSNPVSVDGDAWQKLRNDDFSDLEEHYGPVSIDLETAPALGTSVASSCTLASADALAKIGNVSLEMFAIIRGLMNSNHERRMTLRQLTNSGPIHQMRVVSAKTMDARLSVESRTRSSVDEWEEWSRQRARDEQLSPDITKTESTKPALPALVLEDPGFLSRLLEN